MQPFEPTTFTRLRLYSQSHPSHALHAKASRLRDEARPAAADLELGPAVHVEVLGDLHVHLFFSERHSRFIE
jgi:hypothetical protein